MITEQVSQHASKRCQQRGFRASDLAMIIEHGSSHSDGVVLTAKDVAQKIEEFRSVVTRLERLKGTAVIVKDGEVVSVYRPGEKRLRRMIKEGRSRATSRQERHRAR